MEEQRIVVIDDDRHVRTLIELALVKEGRRVDGFAQGQEALDFLADARNRVALVIADVAMEGFDAHRLLRHLRAVEHTVATPVILLTPAHAEDAEPRPLDELVERLPTPFEVAELRARVNAALAGPRPAGALRDAATGLHTRSDFESRVAAALEAQDEASIAVMAAVVDGRRDAAVLGRVARVVASQLRTGDTAGRIGECTLAALHPRCGAEGASAIASRIVEAIQADAACAGVRLRLGIAVAFEPRAVSAPDLIAEAEDAVAAAGPPAFAVNVRTVARGAQ